MIKERKGEGKMIVLGIDPGLATVGYGVIPVSYTHLAHILGESSVTKLFRAAYDT